MISLKKRQTPCTLELLFSQLIMFFFTINQHKHKYKSNFSVTEWGESLMIVFVVRQEAVRLGSNT